MRVLVLGAGGREHALVWRLSKSPSVTEIHASPGNPGIARLATCHAASLEDPAALASLARSLNIDLTIAGPEAPLVAGVGDAFAASRLAFFGPTAAAARLEGSKIFAKHFMEQHGIPTAQYATAFTPDEAKLALSRFDYPVVLKADGLAAGKGVIIAQEHAEAVAAIDSLMSGGHVGHAGTRLVIEEFLTGEEVSFIAICDGARYLPLRPTQDHKPIFDGDLGPNTGGMGAYCDSRLLDTAMTRQIGAGVIEPVLAGMRDAGHPFQGFLYAGLMMTPAGPKVLEFNVRMGDPETQPLMYSFAGDLAEVLLAASRGDLAGQSLTWTADPAVAVVLAASGYPGKVRAGDEITGIAAAEAAGAVVFQAGTRLEENRLVTAGGRVLAVTASGPTLKEAIGRTYEAAAHIHFDGMQYRRDIGAKGLKRW